MMIVLGVLVLVFTIWLLSDFWTDPPSVHTDLKHKDLDKRK